MKSLVTLFVLTLSISAISSFLKLTPKALDLSDHFGTETTTSIYGPKPPAGGINLMRRGAAGGAPITPIRNFAAQINPPQVKSGDLLNTSYDASRIIDPEIARPKVEIKTNFNHAANVKTPVQLGTVVQENSVKTMDRATGKILTQKTITEKPVLGILNTTKNVWTPHSTTVDLLSGKIVASSEKPIYHGLK